MSHKQSHLPQEIYHRIYWFAKRNVDPRVIAVTLKLPLKTVQHFIAKLSSIEQLPPPSHSDKGKSAAHHREPSPSSPESDFLDVYFFSKTRHVIMDISGMITKSNSEKLKGELQKLIPSEWKAVALRMTDVKKVDEEGFSIILSFLESQTKTGRYSAILDPSASVDSFLSASGLDRDIPVFGTESAFEEKAFS
jgi:anti-anti-sigma factor